MNCSSISSSILFKSRIRNYYVLLTAELTGLTELYRTVLIIFEPAILNREITIP